MTEREGVVFHLFQTGIETTMEACMILNVARPCEPPNPQQGHLTHVQSECYFVCLFYRNQ